MTKSTLGIYIPGESLIHRTNAALKIALLFFWVLGLSLFCQSLPSLIIPTILITTGLRLSRISVHIIGRNILPTLPFVALIAIYQWWMTEWTSAVRIFMVILLALLAATLVTLTTSTTELLDGYLVLLKPLEKLGVNISRIALVCSLTLQLIPAMSTSINDIREARNSRGAERSLRALFLPLVIRIVRRADTVADALIARGYED